MTALDPGGSAFTGNIYPIKTVAVTPDSASGQSASQIQALLSNLSPAAVAQAGSAHTAASVTLADIADALAQHAQVLSESWQGPAAGHAITSFQQLQQTASNLAEAGATTGSVLTWLGETVLPFYQSYKPQDNTDGGDIESWFGNNPQDTDAQQVIARLNNRLVQANGGLPESVTKNLAAFSAPAGADTGNGAGGGTGGGTGGGFSGSGAGGGAGGLGGMAGAGVLGGGSGPGGGGPGPGIPGPGGTGPGGGLSIADPGPLTHLAGHGPLPGPDPNGFSPGGGGAGLGIPGPDLNGFSPGGGGAGLGIPGPGGIGPGGIGPGGVGPGGVGAGGVGPGGVGPGGVGPGGVGAGGVGPGGGASFGGMPMMMGGGGAGDRERERQRLSWMDEDEDFWEGETGLAPPLIGS